MVATETHTHQSTGTLARPEQIRILEAIFNSGMVNPPRDESRKIRAQLQEYGQVGDATVFYWFQNWKSRSKHKQRQQLHNSAAKSHPPPQTTAAPVPITTTLVNNTARNSSQSSSDGDGRSCRKKENGLSEGEEKSKRRSFFQLGWKIIRELSGMD